MAFKLLILVVAVCGIGMLLGGSGLVVPSWGFNLGIVMGGLILLGLVGFILWLVAPTKRTL